MKSPLFFVFSLMLILSSCTKEQETSSADSSEAVDSSKGFSQTIENVNDKGSAIAEAIKEVERALKQASKSNDAMKNVQLSISDDYILVYENSANGKERVELDIRQLDKAKVRLVDEGEGNGFPGFAFGTFDDENNIKYTVGGERKEINEFKLLFENREAVGRVIPVFIQSMNIAQGEYDQYYNE